MCIEERLLYDGSIIVAKEGKEQTFKHLAGSARLGSASNSTRTVAGQTILWIFLSTHIFVPQTS